MARYIDADRLIGRLKYLGKLHPRAKWLFDFVVDVLEKTPTVDAVEVVRCKDCKYWEEAEDWCKACNQIRVRDHFCLWGERKVSGTIH